MSTGITLVGLPTSYASLPGGVVAYSEAGPPDAVATAVFVPGYTGSKEDFGLLAAPLAEAGVRYVAIDQPGQFESPGPDDPTAYTVPLLSSVLLDFLAYLDAPVHLVGHSFGGLVARDAVIRSAFSVLTLTLLDSGPAALSGPRAERMRLLEPLLAASGMAGVYEAMLSIQPSPPDAEVAAFLRTRFLRSNPAALRGMGDALTAEPDRVDALRAAGVPLLVAWGAGDDAWTPEAQRAMAERLGAPYAEIPGSVHSPAAEQPERTARLLLEFWLG